jgi:hypothetical protein
MALAVVPQVRFGVHAPSFLPSRRSRRTVASAPRRRLLSR